MGEQKDGRENGEVQGEGEGRDIEPESERTDVNLDGLDTRTVGGTISTHRRK